MVRRRNATQSAVPADARYAFPTAAARTRALPAPALTSFGLHALIIIAILLPAARQHRPSPRVVPLEIMQATTVDVARLDDLARERNAALEQLAREQAAEEQAAREKVEAERRAAEAERIRIAEQKAAREKAAQEKAAQEKAEAERREQERLAAEAAEAERRAREKAEAERAQREQADLLAALEAEEAQLAAAEQAAAEEAELARYVAAFRSRFGQNFVYPDKTTTATCVLAIELLPGGDVLDVRVVQSSGDPLFDRQAQAAVRKSSPLPVPTDPTLFAKMRRMQILFDPS